MTRQKATEYTEGMLEEAALWHARIGDAAAGEDVWIAFTDWLETNELHKDAFDHIEMTMEGLIGMEQSVQDALADVDAKENGSKEGVEAASGTVIDAAWRWKKSSIWVGLAAAAAVIMLTISNVSLFQSPEVVTEAFMTAVGEQRLVQLEDGSTIHLNTNSKLEVTMRADTRHTKLAYGEAIFSVAKDRERPFFVDVGDQQVRVVGTKFNILRHAGRVTVTVAEGIVDVAPEQGVLDTGEAEKPARLTAGKQSVHMEGANDIEIYDVNADVFLSWESGILAYEEAPLAYTINELSRYYDVPIKINGDVSHITFSGVLNMRDRDAVLQLLEETLPIKITRDDTVIIVTASK